MRIKFVFVVQTEELDVKELKVELEKEGVIVSEIDEDILSIGDRKCPVTLYYLDGTLGQYIRIRLKYHCVTAEDSEYVLFPIE